MPPTNNSRRAFAVGAQRTQHESWCAPSGVPHRGCLRRVVANNGCSLVRWRTHWSGGNNTMPIHVGVRENHRHDRVASRAHAGARQRHGISMWRHQPPHTRLVRAAQGRGRSHECGVHTSHAKHTVRRTQLPCDCVRKPASAALGAHAILADRRKSSTTHAGETPVRCRAPSARGRRTCVLQPSSRARCQCAAARC